MQYTDTQALILQAITDFGLSVLAIISAIIVIALAYLIFDFGYKTIIQGRTSYVSSKIMFLDHAPFTKPYKTYNRLRSRKWNMENTM